jgi:hypothetical protein
MREPLKPTFVNERARIEEHERMMAEARTRFGVRIICPDCYLPPAQCVHRAPPGTDLPFGVNLG